MNATTSHSSSRLAYGEDYSPLLAPRRVLSSTTRSSSKADTRPKTAPSSQTPKSCSTNTSQPEPPIPKIAIFADALSLKKLREQYQTIRKLPTSPDLSHTKTSSSASELKRPQFRRVVTADPLLAPRLSPQLPELDFESRASFSRRAPASRSSNGVDTGKGPPPAIVTRPSSSYASSSDATRRAQNRAAATLQQQRDKSYNSVKPPTSDAFRHNSGTFEGVLLSETNHTFSLFSPTASGSFEQSLDAVMDRESAYSDAQKYLDERAAKRLSGLSAKHNISGADTEGSGKSTEDLFLNLAQDLPPPRSSGEIERRLSSRGRASAQRNALATSSYAKSRRDSIGSVDSGSRSNIPTTERSHSGLRRASTTSTPPLSSSAFRNPGSAPSDNRFNLYRNRYMNSSSTTPQHSSRRSSVVAESAYARPPTYRPSKLGQFSTRDLDSVSMADSPLDHRSYALRNEHHEAAESVVSGAQSTIWDELQELKSKVQRMELHDKTYTNGSNASQERPKTATTATTPLTTMSSSPKYQFKSGRSPQDSVIGGPAAINAYPVLHQTLARCKEGLTPQVYRALELATSDALELALLTGNGSAGGNSSASVVNGGGGGYTGERQVKRKADNVVRNLQDLCVELCKVSPMEWPDTSSRPGTSNGLPGSSHGLPASLLSRNVAVRAASRASSAEPSMANTSDTARPVPSRALDRIEARRASMMESPAASMANSPREAETFNRNSLQLPSSVDTTPIQQKISQLPRFGTSLLRSRRAQTEEPEEDSPRPVSRAATEIGVLRKRQNRLSGSHLQRSSREYTSQVPLPATSPAAASTPPTSTSLRRLNGTSLRNESPRSASLASSLMLRRAMTEKEATPEVEEPKTPDADTKSRLLRRSLGMYTSSARASLGLGVSKRGERRSVAAAAGGVE